VDTDAGLRHVEALLAVRDELSDRLRIQLVAFPQSGLLIRPGTAELLDRALALGAAYWVKLAQTLLAPGKAA